MKKSDSISASVDFGLSTPHRIYNIPKELGIQALKSETILQFLFKFGYFKNYMMGEKNLCNLVSMVLFRYLEAVLHETKVNASAIIGDLQSAYDIENPNGPFTDHLGKETTTTFKKNKIRELLSEIHSMIEGGKNAQDILETIYNDHGTPTRRKVITKICKMYSK